MRLPELQVAALSGCVLTLPPRRNVDGTFDIDFSVYDASMETRSRSSRRQLQQQLEPEDRWGPVGPLALLRRLKSADGKADLRRLKNNRSLMTGGAQLDP